LRENRKRYEKRVVYESDSSTKINANIMNTNKSISKNIPIVRKNKYTFSRKIETPQEIELWIILPAIKKQIARLLLENYNLEQSEIAKILKITPSAVNQYLKNKRGSSIRFTKEVNELIVKYTQRIYDDMENVQVELIRLLKEREVHSLVCKIHKEIDPRFENCNICP
jgi:predicted transcriptional regulator